MGRKKLEELQKEEQSQRSCLGYNAAPAGRAPGLPFLHHTGQTAGWISADVADQSSFPPTAHSFIFEVKENII